MVARAWIAPPLLVLLAGCSAVSAGSGVETLHHQHTVTVFESTTTTITVPSPESICADKPSGTICTFAGIPHVAQFAAEDLPRLESALYLPIDVTWNAAEGQLYVLDFNNHRVRTVRPDDTVVTVAGTGFLGDGILDPDTLTWEGGAALSFSMNHPTGVAFDPLDPSAMYIAAWHKSRVL
jgi:hypothetical protein